MKDLLKSFGLETFKLVGTPMITRHKLSTKDETLTIEQKKYKSMIGGLQYLTHKRLYIANVVSIVVRFQDDPKESHYVVLKMILDFWRVHLILGYGMTNQMTFHYVHRLM